MVSDPVASGIVPNLAHPNANITGVSNFFPAMISKLLDLIVTASGAKRIAGLHDPGNPGKQVDSHYLQDSARAIQRFDRAGPAAQYRRRQCRIRRDGEKPAGRCDRPGYAVTISNMQLIVGQVAALKLPAIYQERTFVELGGLMSYALNYCQHLRRAAAYVDKILKGEKPSALPVEQPATSNS